MLDAVVAIPLRGHTMHFLSNLIRTVFYNATIHTTIFKQIVKVYEATD